MSKPSYQDLRVSIEDAAALIGQYYGLSIKKLRYLAGEVDFNYYLEDESGRRFTVKISRPEEQKEALDFQLAILLHLEKKNLDLELPIPVAGKDGQYFYVLEGGRFLRIQSWVPGRVAADVNPRSPELLYSWGQATAQVTKALQDFDHPYAHRYYKWDPTAVMDAQELGIYFNEEEGELASYFWSLIEEEAIPKLAGLRRGVNYQDAHELNLLTRDGLVTGVIDFGDAMYSQTINELAVAAAYALMGKANPLRAATDLIAGFHTGFPLEEEEIALLYHMIAARLLISVANAANNLRQEPENEYLQVSAAPAWDLLRKWRVIDPQLAHYSFRKACGWVACPQRAAYDQWLEQHQAELIPPVDLSDKEVSVLDLAVDSLRLGNNVNFADYPRFDKTIQAYLTEEGADMGIGGYGEVRPFYTTDAYAVMGNSGPEWRTVHLGLDVWAPAQTAIYAPLAGRVHSCYNNAGERDYGPTIILEHEPKDGLRFYSLYGHLSLSSLDELNVGQKVEAGQLIAWMGPAPENGNWPPHLHFQLMLDLLGNQHDFPGVAFPEEQDIWLDICPDPGYFFGDQWGDITKKLPPLAQLLQGRHQYLGKGLSTSYAKPLHMVRGYGPYLYDRYARRYLDTVNNVAHVGHEHPKVVQAGQRQIGLLNTNTRYVHESVLAYAEAILAKFPPELCVVHFVNSGSEANELAIRMAKTYSGQEDMLAIEVGYHGNTGACIEVSSYKFDGKGGKGSPEKTHILPIPDVYRGLHRGTDTGSLYAAYTDQAIERVRASGRGIAGFIGESILSCGGQVVPPANYFKEVYAKVRAAGGLCISDEVQVGFGRVGNHFWGFELHDVVPDIVTLGKPIGNGHPIGAVVCTRAVAEAFANGMEFFSTFGGNPVAASIGKTILDVVEEEKLQENAHKQGQYLMEGLRQLQERYPIIGDVRGHGLFLGFELVRNRETLEAADKEASYLANRMRELGCLMSTDGPLHNVIKIKPPICFSKDNADLLLSLLEKVFQEDQMQV